MSIVIFIFIIIITNLFQFDLKIVQSEKALGLIDTIAQKARKNHRRIPTKLPSTNKYQKKPIHSK